MPAAENVAPVSVNTVNTLEDGNAAAMDTPAISGDVMATDAQVDNAPSISQSETTETVSEEN
jgi:hypothetical protein